MPQSIQIVPTYQYPYVHTVINDNSQVIDEVTTNVTSPIITYAFPFVSSKGIDNVFVKKTSLAGCKQTFGESNYKKYGQPYMMPLNVLSENNTNVWCMRVMPENAAYSNAVVLLWYKADEASYETPASERKFRIKFTQQTIENATSIEEFNTAVKNIPLQKDEEGYTPIVFMTLRSEGRGTYGDNYRLKVAQNSSYEKEYGIKMYNFTILAMENGLNAIATYTGSIVSSVQYENSTLINDVLSSVDAGIAPVQLEVNEDSLEDVYDAYVEFCKEQNVALKDEYAEILDSPEVQEEENFDRMVEGTVITPVALKDTVAKVREILSLIEISEDDNTVSFDEFDPVLGLDVAKNTSSNFISITTDDTTVSFTSAKGITMSGGSNGYFDAPRMTDLSGEVIVTRKIKNSTEDGEIEYDNDEFGNPLYVNEAGEEFAYTEVKQWTYEMEVENCYNRAFNGTLDPRILSTRRIGVDAWFDANYPLSVKRTLADLVITRNDGLVYLDTGIEDTSYSSSRIKTLVADYTFDNKLVSVNLQHFKTRESSTKKKVTVSITYFLARQFAQHLRQESFYTPFVKGRCYLANHVKDSLEPSIDDYQTDVKESLYTNRFNFFETLGENIYQRATQITSQQAETDLIEENNVHTLYRVKRILEADIEGALYDFADSTTRKSFTDYETSKFSSWIGRAFQKIDINFTVNAWEFDHSIVHCYVAIVFRSLQKRAILEIDINKREYTDNAEEANEFTYSATSADIS